MGTSGCSWPGPRAINLTAIREPGAVATAHVADSLTALPWLAGRGAPSILDLGSGGGFPGLPLAAALPDTEVLLLEAVAKKARFLDTVVAATGLAERVRVVPARAEALARAPEHRDAWSVVTARAVAATADLVELAFPLLAPGGALVAWKRGDLQAELAAAERALHGPRRWAPGRHPGRSGPARPGRPCPGHRHPERHRPACPTRTRAIPAVRARRPW